MKLFHVASEKGYEVDDETRDVLAVLTSHAELALRAGVRMSLSEWCELTSLERAAFTAAGDRLEVRRAQRFGLATNGPRGVAAAAVELDGGAEHDEWLLEEAVAATVLRIKQEGALP